MQCQGLCAHLVFRVYLIFKGHQSCVFIEGLMLKLKLQYFGQLMRRADSFERPWRWERLKAGGEGDDRGWHGWMASPTQWTWVWVNSGSWWWTGRPGMLQFMGSQRVGHNWATELTDWPFVEICALNYRGVTFQQKINISVFTNI